MSETNTVSPLRQRMIEDMAARKLNPHTQRSQHHSAASGSPPGSNAHPIHRRPTRCAASNCTVFEGDASICNRNRNDDRGALPVPRHLASPRSGGRDLAYPGAAEAAAGIEP